MQFGFNTESIEHGKAALLLYGLYRSRSENSSLNGLDTWTRFASYIRGAVIKSTNVAEFVQHFSKKANIGSIKPHHFKTDGLVQIDSAGTLMVSEGVYDYRLDFFETSEILELLESESLYIIMLVREKIQREKEAFQNENN